MSTPKNPKQGFLHVPIPTAHAVAAKGPKEELSRVVLGAARSLASSLPYQEIPIHRIAQEAKVAKSTVYRWWPTKALLIFEALFPSPLDCPDTGNLEEDLIAWMRAYSSMYLRDEVVDVQLGMWAELCRTPKDVSSKAQEHKERSVQIAKTILARATRRGEVRRAVDPRLLEATLVGSLRQQCLYMGIPQAEIPAEKMVQFLMPGFGALRA